MIKRLLIFSIFISFCAFGQSLVQVLPAPDYAYGLTFDGSNLWAGSSNGYELWQIDPETGAVTGSINALVDETRGIGWDASNSTLWAYHYIFGSSSGREDMIINYDTGGTPLDTLYSPYEDYIGGACFADGFFWISVYYTGSGNPAYLVKIDPATGAFVDTLVSPGLQPQGLAYDGTSLWLAMDDNDGDPENIYEINPETGEVLSQFPIPPYGSTVTARPRDMAWDGQHLYLVVGNNTDKAIYKFDMGSSGTPQIHLSADELNFPITSVGDTSILPLTITNAGDADLTIDQFNIQPDVFEFAETPSVPYTIAPSDYLELDVRFIPANLATYNGSIQINSDDPQTPQAVTELNGEGVLAGPVISVAPAAYNFGQIWVPSDGTAYHNVIVENVGGELLTITSLDFNLEEYSVSSQQLPINIYPTQSTTLTITFSPQSPGIYTDTLRITSNDPATPVAGVNYEGEGIRDDYSYGYKFWDFTVPENPNTSYQDYRVEGINSINDITGDGVDEVIISTDNYWTMCLDGASAGEAIILWTFNSYFSNINAGSIGMSNDYGVQDALSIASDLNYDGKNDVVIGLGGGNEHVYAIDGTNGQIIWQFGDEVNYSLGDFEAVDAERDFNGDGVPDVLASADGNETGNGYKSAFLFNGFDGDIIWQYHYPGPNLSFGKTIISVDDVTGDGKPDAALAVGNNGSTDLKVYLLDGATGTPQWNFEASSYEHKELLELPIPGETPDIIVAEYFGVISRVDGETGLAQWNATLGALAGVIQMDLIRDINADGIDDILIAAFTNGVTCLSGDNGQVIWSWSMANQYGVASVPDLDNDGIDEVFTGDQNGAVYLIKGQGDELLFSYNFSGDKINSVHAMRSIDGNDSYELIAGTRNGKVACFSGGLNALATGWYSDITLTDGENNGYLRFGQDVNGTDGIDSQLGEIELPPVPPAGAFDIRFNLPVTPTVSSKYDFRNSEITSPQWEMQFQPGSAGYPMTISWNPFQLPDGAFTLKDPFGGSIVNVNMKEEGSVEITNTSLNKLVIEYSSSGSVSVSVAEGWNIVSVPLEAADMTVNGLFPTASSNAFGFTSSGYFQTDELVNGDGYWLKFDSAEDIPVEGSPVAGNLPVDEGWNLVGPFDYEVTVSGITSIPAGIISGLFFGYNAGYTQADVLEPGKGYWVKTTAQGELVLNNPAKIAPSVTKETGYLLVQDAAGHSSKIYCGRADFITAEMPPLPPQGIFDARLESGNIGVEASANDLIVISSAVYPVTISARNTSVNLRDGVNGQMINATISDGDKIVISDNSISRLVISGSEIPVDYALDQNYPNPFNPATTISFSLPVREHVTINVYNMLGQKAATLVNEIRDAGNYNITFDASDLSSGVYFYSINAGSFSATKKMILMK